MSLIGAISRQRCCWRVRASRPERGTGETRCRRSRGQAGLRDDMVSSNEAGFNLREKVPLPRNTLHSLGYRPGFTRQRTNLTGRPSASGCRGWLLSATSSKDEKGRPDYHFSVRDTAKSGIGCKDNRHLNHLVESIAVNVGEPWRDAKASSPPMP